VLYHSTHNYKITCVISVQSQFYDYLGYSFPRLTRLFQLSNCVNLTFICSNIPEETALRVYIYQLIRYSRTWGSNHGCYIIPPTILRFPWLYHSTHNSKITCVISFHQQLQYYLADIIPIMVLLMEGCSNILQYII
jgi:hypothetical protein